MAIGLKVFNPYRSIFLYWEMVFLLLLLEISSAFEQRPHNTVVKIGESFELSCSSASLPIEWYHTPWQTNDLKKISKGYNLTFYLYGDIPGQRLRVPLAQEEHAGIYTCSVMKKETTSEASAVVVIADDPICEMKSKTSLMENDTVEFRCSVSFLGPVFPLMRWKQLTDTGWKELNCTQPNSMSRISCQLNCLADLTMHRSRFQCQTSFQNVRSTTSHARIADNNTFNYSYLWTSDAIRILYGPRNLVVYPPDGAVYPNEQVNCSAEGFPPPSIEWINLRTNETIRGPRLSLDKALAGDGTTLKLMCRAVNLETNKTSNISIEYRDRATDLSITTHGQKDGSLYFLTKLLLSALVVSLVVIGVLVLYIVARKRKKRRKERAMARSTLADIKCRQKVPLHRVSRHNFPQGVAKLEQHPNNIDQLSTPSDPTQTGEGDYDEITDGQTLSVENIVYFDLPSTKSLALPSSSSSAPSPALPRTRNVYMRASDNELPSTDQLYESLRMH